MAATAPPATRGGSRRSRPPALLLLATAALVLAPAAVVRAEIQAFNVVLPATSGSIHYADLYLRGPGSVDVSGLVLTPISGVHRSYYPAPGAMDDDGGGAAAPQDDDDDDDGNNRRSGDDHTPAGKGNTAATNDDDGDAQDDRAPPANGHPSPAQSPAQRPVAAPTNDDDGDDDGADDDDDGKTSTTRAGDDAPATTHQSHTDDAGDDGGGGRGLRWRRLDAPEPTGARRQRQERGLQESGRTFVDFVAFKLPSDCANSKAGCDWTGLGIGARHTDGTLRWCCSADAAALGLCDRATELGRLIVDQGKLPGKKRQIPIPNSGDVSRVVNDGLINEEESGNYVLIMANCNDAGRDILVTGEAAYKSVHGYLPGELWGFLYFFAALTIVYFFAFLWYAAAMSLNVDSRIPIEKWILTTIGLGLSEMVFKTADTFVWNVGGYRQIWLCYAGILLGVVKRGWSRGLIVMVSLGWGVTRDTLGRKYKWIFMLCMLYIGLSAFCDLTIVIAVSEMETLSENAETKLYDVYTVLTFIIAAVDVIFVMWILDALASTMEHLESMSQTRKLKRYLRLRSVFLFSVLFAAAWAMFAVANAYTDGIVGEEDSWMVDGATELNYLIVMVAIACLWRPSASAREYAYAMELPSSNSYEGHGNELELSGATVPSAVDSDDEYDDGYVDTKQGRTNGAFKDEPSPRTIT